MDFSQQPSVSVLLKSIESFRPRFWTFQSAKTESWQIRPQRYFLLWFGPRCYFIQTFSTRETEFALEQQPVVFSCVSSVSPAFIYKLKLQRRQREEQEFTIQEFLEKQHTVLFLRLCSTDSLLLIGLPPLFSELVLKTLNVKNSNLSGWHATTSRTLSASQFNLFFSFHWLAGSMVLYVVFEAVMVFFL